MWNRQKARRFGLCTPFVVTEGSDKLRGCQVRGRRICATALQLVWLLSAF